MGNGQAGTATQFFVYGRSHFTRNGYLSSLKKSPTKERFQSLDGVDLSGKVFIVTGANSGCGREVTKWLSSKNGKVYMICRNLDRANQAKTEILRELGKQDDNTINIIAPIDCSLKSDIHKCWDQFSSKEKELHGLLCNAGVLKDEATFNSVGDEVTLATHLTYGTYLLSKLALPTLSKSKESRLVFMSSGGMLASPFPKWKDLLVSENDSEELKKQYDGQLQYSKAKRGQVILAEQFQRENPEIKVVSCHPGWTDTPGVDEAYGTFGKLFLKPLRSLWEGVAGVCWLLSTENSNIEGGAFYLDCAPQAKHVDGMFANGEFSNTSEEIVTDMMSNLERVTK